ncbi:MAG: L-histidine N(alpha)-methyltransferase [Bacteroidales bacterium]|nr:L-histidine N(alpha)-methyltransferase [Bacteroidales bacterium]
MENGSFAHDVKKGLSASPKYLPSKYFYDEEGDRLFQQIMELDEYYLTQSEYQIIDHHKNDLLRLFQNGSAEFSLIEFGAGDGLKSKILLDHFYTRETPFRYVPIDISPNILEELVDDVKSQYDDLKIEAKPRDYFEALQEMNQSSKARKAILFLGSNIGNFQWDEAIAFLKKLSNNMLPDDLLLIGFDLKKNPEIIINAYNDNKKVTREFNLNLLNRINRELGGNFVIDDFKHYPLYDPETGKAKSYLVSTKEQEVYIDAVKERFYFKAWEPVFMEISQKYDLKDIEDLANKSGFEVTKNFFDQNGWFVDSIWRLKQE